MERCIECGAELPADQARCPACQTLALGARLTAKVAIALGEEPRVPAMCCCCLGPKDEDVLTPLAVGQKRVAQVKVPWCQGCKQRSSLVVLFLIAGLLGLSAHLVGVVWLLDPGAHGMMALALFVGMGGGPILGLQLANRLNKRGHVPRCTAVSSRAHDACRRDGAPGGKLSFGNRAFAREWVRLNPRRRSADAGPRKGPTTPTTPETA